jgi:hypothetical protein
VSATWADVSEQTIELQAVRNQLVEDSELDVGLKTGPRVALRYGRQPDHALVFQALSKDGPLWYEDGFPVEWSDDYYKCWTASVWRPARRAAAQAPDTEQWISDLTFYELRHSAISTALHSTLAMTRDGMNLHALAAYAGHDVQTLQRHYAHVIARYRGAPPIDLVVECDAALRQVTAQPCAPPEPAAGPQLEAQRGRRARATAARCATSP